MAAKDTPPPNSNVEMQKIPISFEYGTQSVLLGKTLRVFHAYPDVWIGFNENKYRAAVTENATDKETIYVLLFFTFS